MFSDKSDIKINKKKINEEIEKAIKAAIKVKPQ